MTADEILMLVRAGYTKDEITQLCGAAPEKPAEEKPAEEKHEEKPAEEKHEEAPTGNNNADELGSIKKQLDYLIAKQNYDAVKGSKMPEEHVESVDDILASIISNKGE